MVIQQSVTFADEKSYYLHKNLRAVDHNLLLSHLKLVMYGTPDQSFLSPEQIRQNFECYPAIIENTERLIGNCSIDFDYNSIKNKKTFTGSLYDDKILLEKLTLDGFKYRYSPKNKSAMIASSLFTRFIALLFFGL